MFYSMSIRRFLGGAGVCILLMWLIVACAGREGWRDQKNDATRDAQKGSDREDFQGADRGDFQGADREDTTIATRQQPLNAPAAALPATPKPRIISSSKPPAKSAARVMRGKASFYGGKFHGRRTANGEIFDQHKLTAAHRSLPFGTICRVRNLRNGNYVMVRINDRGPFVGNRIIDLSYGAARELDGIREGIMNVELEIVSRKN